MISRGVLGLSFVVVLAGGLHCSSRPAEEPMDALDSALSAADYDATVQHLTALPWLPWAYTPDGCYARASYYSMLLATKGVPTNHLYVVAQPGTALGGIWGWHVAPLVTKDGDPNHVYVLDPVYNTTKALTNVQWVEHQGYADPDATDYPSLHVHKGNSYLAQYNSQLPLQNPDEPTAATYKEPTFVEMPAFKMTDVAHACSTMHRYIDVEPGTSPAQKNEKHRSLGRETQRIVAGLATKGKLSGSPTLSLQCTRGESLDGGAATDAAATDAAATDGSVGDAGTPPEGDDFVDPTRQR